MDLTSENSASLGVGTTTFTVLNSSGEAASAGYDSDGEGAITFTKAGLYYVQMANDAITSDWWDGNTSVATATTGAIRIFSDSYARDLAGAASPNAVRLASAIDRAMNSGYEPSDAIDSVLVAYDESGDAGVLDSLHGETLVGGMHAVSRAASTGFFRALYKQSGRLAPYGAGGRSGAGSWTANASVSGCGAVNGGGVFADATAAHLSSHDGYFGYDLYNAGANAFLDRWVSSDLLVGGAFGVTHTRVDWDRFSAKTSANNFSGGLYGSWRRDGFALSAQAVLGYSDVNTSRRLAGGGQSYSGDYDMWWGGAGLRASYDFRFGSDTRVTPSLGFDYVYSRSESFRERGAGGAALAVGSQHTDSLEGMLDVEIARDFQLGSFVFTPSARVGAAVQMADRRTTARTRFASEPALPAFRAESAKLDRARLVYGLGADLAVSDRVTLEFTYDGSVQSDYNDHQFRLGVKIAF